MTIKKLECVGHIQKRMGNRLRNLRKSLKGTKLSDGKGIAGKGRLRPGSNVALLMCRT